MWANSKSVKLTYVLVWVVIAVLVAALFLIPPFARWYDYVSFEQPIFGWLCAALYLCLVPAFVAMAQLLGLLHNIRFERIFVQVNTRHLRVLAYCCFAECAIFLALGILRPTSLVVSFAACFFGLILRVLKNVFEKAVELREENDAVI